MRKVWRSKERFADCSSKFGRCWEENSYKPYHKKISSPCKAFLDVCGLGDHPGYGIWSVIRAIAVLYKKVGSGALLVDLANHTFFDIRSTPLQEVLIERRNTNAPFC
jgi:hypothetical protein